MTDNTYRPLRPIPSPFEFVVAGEPVQIDESTIISGRHRLEALRQINPEEYARLVAHHTGTEPEEQS